MLYYSVAKKEYTKNVIMIFMHRIFRVYKLSGLTSVSRKFSIGPRFFFFADACSPGRRRNQYITPPFSIWKNRRNYIIYYFLTWMKLFLFQVIFTCLIYIFLVQFNVKSTIDLIINAKIYKPRHITWREPRQVGVAVGPFISGGRHCHPSGMTYYEQLTSFKILCKFKRICTTILGENFTYFIEKNKFTFAWISWVLCMSRK